MYVPMARFPSAPMTFVATRSMSPASFMRWKMVKAHPTWPEISSTSGVEVAGSSLCPSQSPPMSSFGRVTGVASFAF